MSNDRIAFEGSVQHRTRYLFGIALWVAAVVAGAGWFFSRGSRDHWTLPFYGLFLLAGGLGFGWRLFETKKGAHPTQARIDARGVALDGKMALAAADIAEGAYLRPIEAGGISVVVPSKRTFGALDLGVRDEAEGLRVLEALGQDPARTKVRFRLAGGFENKTLRQVATVVLGLSTSCGGIVNGNGEVFHVLFVLWSAALVLAGVSFLLPTYVTVGSDGLYIERRARRRFVPFTSIREMKRDIQRPDAVVLTLVGDEEVILRTKIRDQQNVKESEMIVRRALETRLEKSLALFRERTHGAEASLFLKRGGRSTKDWRESLEKLQLERGYREARITDDQLWAVLEDPAASPEDRAAALVALRAATDDAGKARQRVALEASAEPRLRVVLAAAEKEDAAELEAALDDLREKTGAEKA